jgi:hypothetical protein
MTDVAKRGLERKRKLKPKAWVGYLVGYDPTNIYRIWNPATNTVVRTRDVVFDEHSNFSPDLQNLAQDVKEVDLEALKNWLSANDVTNAGGSSETVEEDEEEVPPVNASEASPTLGNSDGDIGDETTEEILDTIVVKGDATSTFPEFQYPTPPPTPPAALIATAFTGIHCNDRDSPQSFEPWKAAFHAGALVNRPLPWRPAKNQAAGQISRKEVEQLQRTGVLSSIHQADLPPEPRWHHDLQEHPFGHLFEEAEREHLQSHAEMASWKEVPHRVTQPGSKVRRRQVLGCMWVYAYKVGKTGHFVKCKARLVVRGDQQRKNLTEDTYAATLAGRSFRTLLSTAARFNLELKQFDAVNAFVNASLDEDIFMEMPPGHRKQGTVLKLQKALYGLRKSPLLWQNELTTTLTSLGLKTVPHEPCVAIKNGIIVFFYVDDIVVAYRRRDRERADQVIKGLKNKYQLTGGDDLHWFLGMEVHRDRAQRLIWLSQSAYIDKIARLASSADKTVKTPMLPQELLPYDEVASHASINLYQRKVGSVLYAAINTRPDVAFAISRLARFNNNPGPAHHAAADRVLHYLVATRNLALQLGGGNGLIVASDSSFADNSLDRKSSQGFAIMLFGGLIAWRANKQDTVTTSTTEAELLALAQATKEGKFVQRLLKELTIHLDDHVLTVQCDNAQTIRLVNATVATLQTKLRHVDIHNHWLRQEAQNGRLRVEYTQSKRMMADGLTKALTVDPHQKFVAMLGLVAFKGPSTGGKE